MKIVFSQEFLELPAAGGHPEKPERLQAIKSFLEKQDGMEFVEPLPATENDLELVHSPAYVEQLKLLSRQQRALSPDNPFSKKTFETARLAAGAAIKAAQISLKEGFSFALVRPPGHHASRNASSGFCYLNNVAIAIKKMMAENPKVKKVFVVDYDLHCGDGTEQIFYDDSAVFYYSIHQNPQTIFPFHTGFPEQDNEHVRNTVVEPGTGDEEYLALFKKTLAESLSNFDPDAIAVSAGFDSFHEDYYAGNQLQICKPQTYNEIGKTIKESAGGKPVFAVLEGGYFLPKLGENVYEFLKAFL